MFLLNSKQHTDGRALYACPHPAIFHCSPKGISISLIGLVVLRD